MTGSYNWNETAQVFNDENMVVLEDPAVAAAYRAEFAELWGEAEERPTPLVLRDPEVRERHARVYEARRRAAGRNGAPVNGAAPKRASSTNEAGGSHRLGVSRLSPAISPQVPASAPSYDLTS